MKKITVSLVFLMSVLSLQAQDFNRYLQPLAVQYGLTQADIENFEISSAYRQEDTQMRHVYLTQTVAGFPIRNAVLQLHIHNGEELKFHNSRFIPNAARKVENTTIGVAWEDIQERVLSLFQINSTEKGSLELRAENLMHWEFAQFFIHPVRMRRVFLLVEDQLKLTYEVVVEPRSANAETLYFSALDGTLLRRHNRTLACQFDHDPEAFVCAHESHKHDEVLTLRNLGQALYTAYPLGIESPLHGPRTSINAAEYAPASPFGWHDVNGAPGAEFTITRGNNVHAHEDIANTNLPGYAPDGGANLVFDFPFDQGGAPMTNMDASITNLFVWNNFMHDVSYFYGFNEVSGNFQQTNYSGQGQGGDYVQANGFDGSGTNNANFATPEDGFNPVMQMYIWHHIVGDLLEITEPEVLSGSYETGSSSFGVLPPSNPFTSNVVLVYDNTSEPSLGCGFITNGGQVSGKIALIDRGVCPFVQKVINAQNAGAIGVIIANNQSGGPMSMGGSDPGNINIPVLSISQELGELIKTQLANGQEVAAKFGGDFEQVEHDSSFDNGIIAHEYVHGISNRLTGGPNEIYCLSNDEQMGEGWSDFFALIVSDTLGAQGNMPRGIGNFASNKPANAGGIRPYPYTTDMILNPLTYADIAGLSIPHGLGSVWCTMLWDLYWAFVDVYGHSHNLYSNSGGNNRAIRLVMEGMRLQTCSPGFEDGRDAILAADEVLFQGANQCLIWQTFARRGLGYNAYQGSSFMVGDEIEDFDVPPFCVGGLSENVAMTEYPLLYPNPGTHQLWIRLPESSTPMEIKVYAASGKLIESKTASGTLEFNTEFWDKGLYIVEIKGLSQCKNLRWIKI